MEFRILGPLEVIADAGAVSLGRLQQRAVLAVLVVCAGERVSRDRLVDALWGERPPASAGHAVEVYVSGIRKALGPGADGAPVRASRGGYVLEVDPERVDARRFERLAGEAQHLLAEDPSRARELVERALALWRGPPLAELSQFEFARREADRLEQLRAAALEGLVEARIAGGEHDQVIGQLTALVAANPLRERPQRLLMLALYRAGRHAEALTAYRDACDALDEIGLHPGPELRQLQAAILRHDPSLQGAHTPAGTESHSDSLAQAGPDFRGLPAGSVTMLFTDIEGSTRLAERLGDCYPDTLTAHHRLVREAIQETGGHEVGTAGDSFFAVFGRAADAIECARRAQLALGAGVWPSGAPPRVRIGIHTGTPVVAEGQIVGMDVHRAARVMAAAHGGQVLLTEETRRAAGAGVAVRDLGFHRLKDLPEPERLFQLLGPGLSSDFGSLRSLNRSNLPRPTTGIVGREAELVAGLDRLARQDVRLLTLIGPGGVGKTRLALELAGEVAIRYRDGVWMVALAPLPDRAAVVSEVCRVLEVTSSTGEPPEVTLGKALADREMLLVLDNFEHLLDAVDVVADLLAVAPKVDVLCTSREPLRIQGEYRLDVPPLAQPEARDLFLQRARAVNADLALSAQDLAAVERICARLDGLPLAVELAAARAGVLPPHVIDSRLTGLALPSGARDLPERQRTLHATIDWSFRLLDGRERELFVALAPFIGGVRLESAEELWGSGTIDRLVSLVEKSLVRERTDFDGEPRFWMLETIRAFSLSHASADGRDASVHAEHFLALSNAARGRLHGREQRFWLDRLEAEHPNLGAALDYLLAHSSSSALAMAGNLAWYWDIRGYAPEGRRWIAQALAAAPPDAPGREAALVGVGHLAVITGQYADGETPLLEALALADDRNSDRWSALALTHLAASAWATGRSAESVSRHERALAAARAAGDDWVLGIALNNYAIYSPVLMDPARVEAALEESLLCRRRTGEPRGIAITASNLALMALNRNDVGRGLALAEEALQSAREVRFRGVVANALGIRVEISLLRGDVEQAISRLREQWETILPYDIEITPPALSVAATVAAAAGNPLQAATLYAAADRALAQVGIEEPQVGQRLRQMWEPRARSLVSIEQWDDAASAGAAMTIEDGLALVAADLSAPIGG